MVVSSKERGMRCRIKDVIRQQKKSHLEVGEHFDAQRLNGPASKPNERRTGLHRQIENQFLGSGGHSAFGIPGFSSDWTTSQATSRYSPRSAALRRASDKRICMIAVTAVLRVIALKAHGCR
jgi:hypothetical protein